MFPKTFFLEGGGEILREINGQDQQYSIAIVYGINNTSSKIIDIKNNEFSDRLRKCAFCSRTLHMTNGAAVSKL